MKNVLSVVALTTGLILSVPAYSQTGPESCAGRLLEVIRTNADHPEMGYSKTTWTYESDHRIQTSFEAESGAWEPTGRSTYFLKPDGRVDRVVFEANEGGLWSNMTKEVVTHVPSERAEVWEAFAWERGGWVQMTESRTVSDEQGRLHYVESTPITDGVRGATTRIEHEHNGDEVTVRSYNPAVGKERSSTHVRVFRNGRLVATSAGDLPRRVNAPSLETIMEIRKRDAVATNMTEEEKQEFFAHITELMSRPRPIHRTTYRYDAFGNQEAIVEEEKFEDGPWTAMRETRTEYSPCGAPLEVSVWQKQDGAWVSTGSRTAYVYDQSGQVTSGSELPGGPAVIESLYPNPASDRATLVYTLSGTSNVQLSVFDAAGRRVAQRAEGAMRSGTHELSIAVSDLPPGVYAIRLEVGEEHVSRVITVQ